ncbi:DUF1801 domain-containing protein [Flavimaricola marinus]|uniref:DUF1801 domain-containing protein n=1 Tax=Flavimaricola marinus TaxID=1819565 RepID=UPI00145587A7|nr:DUF1801 domain-containing protein [Flavimaricola marinus]
MVEPPAAPPEVAAAYAAFDDAPRDRLLALRARIFAAAAADPVIGPLTEALRWGEPAYLTEATKSGTTIRLGVPRSAPETAALYVNCRTSIIEGLRAQFPDCDAFDGNRAILLRPGAAQIDDVLHAAIARALRYHKPA